MDDVRCAYELFQKGSSECSEQVAQDVGNNDYGRGKLDVQILSETYQQYHCHCKQGQQQFILYTCHSAAQGYNGMQDCK